MMITAKEAREMSGPSAEDYLKFIEKKIIEAADKKAKSVTIRDEPYCMFLYSEKNNSQEINKAIKILRDNGFQLKMHYQEMSIAVDMGLIVEW